MAKLNQPESGGFEIGDLAPVSTFVATCLDVQDQFGVERSKFENPNEKETLDVTRFLFGFQGQDGRSYRVQSFEFRISGSPKSNLFKFLTSWLGGANLLIGSFSSLISTASTPMKKLFCSVCPSSSALPAVRQSKTRSMTLCLK